MSLVLISAFDLLQASIGQVALTPLVTAALLFLLTKSPDRLRGRIITALKLKDTKRYVRVLKALKYCLAFGLTSALNKKLNSMALNQGRWSTSSEKKRWNWSKEVAVVTGGCSGIGALMVKKLAARGVRVAVLDIQDLPPSLQNSESLTPPNPPQT